MTARTAIRPRKTPILLLVLAALLGLVLGCGSGGGPGPGGSPAPAPGSDTIVIKNFAYEPPSLTVAPGATIAVVNEDAAPHTVTAEDKSFDSGNLTRGQRGQISAPTKPGSYRYICTIHPFMAGTLMVK